MHYRVRYKPPLDCFYDSRCLCRLNVEWGIPWCSILTIWDDGSSYYNMSPFSASCFIWYSLDSRIQEAIGIVMFRRLIEQCRTLNWAAPESWCKSLVRLWQLPGHKFCKHLWQCLFCPSWATRANACCFPLHTQIVRENTAWFAVLRYRLVLPTLGVVTNTEECHEPWNMSCISVCLSLPMSAYMWKISTWSTKYLVSHHIQWWTWPSSKQHRNALCVGGALASAFWGVSWSRRSAWLDESDWSGSGCSAGSLIIIARNISLSHQAIRESTQVLSSQYLYNCPKTLLQLLLSPKTNKTEC